MTVKALVKAVSFAVQVRAMAGDKAAQAAVRTDVIRSAIYVAVKGGNDNLWVDGHREAASMKTATAKALVKGFDAVGRIGVLIKPQEAKGMDAATKEARYAARTDELLAVFMAEFDAAMPKPLTEEEKKAKTEEREAAQAVKLADAVESAIKERGLVQAGDIATPADLYRSMLDALSRGLINDDMQADLLKAMGVPAMLESRYEAGRAAGEAAALDAAQKAKADAAKLAKETTAKAKGGKVKPAPAAPVPMAPATVKVDGKDNMVPAVA